MTAANLVPEIGDEQLWKIMSEAEDLGLGFELTEQGIVWEAMPGKRHQVLSFTIASSIHSGGAGDRCDCFQARDVYIRFSRRVVKRPDISVFCREPQEEEDFIHSIPEAVIEITSPDSEGKDLVSGPPIYLANGVKDVLVLQRSQNLVHHWTLAGSRVLSSPTTVTLQCGCVVTL
jgi:Uma2 family endonuclease